MNVLEAFALFVVMIVVFWFFGLIGLAVLGLIICLCYFGSKPEKSKREKVACLHYSNKPKGSLENREKGKPCHPHGLTNCPYCNPSVYNYEEEVDSETEEKALIE
jgi:hypothetical protein